MCHFRNYFSGAKHICVPGRTFPVKEIFLEDILLGLNYSTPAMDKMKRLNQSGYNRTRALESITKNLSLNEDPSRNQASETHFVVSSSGTESAHIGISLLMVTFPRRTTIR